MKIVRLSKDSNLTRIEKVFNWYRFSGRGPQGEQGDPGPGLPVGGDPGDGLTKNSSTDYGFAILKHNLNSNTAPTVNNDETEGYEQRSFWFDVVLNKVYQCIDPLTGNAEWADLTQSGGGGGGFDTIINTIDLVGLNEFLRSFSALGSSNYDEIIILIRDGRVSNNGVRLRLYGSTDNQVTFTNVIQGGWERWMASSSAAGSQNGTPLNVVDNYLHSDAKHSHKADIVFSNLTEYQLIDTESTYSNQNGPWSGGKEFWGAFASGVATGFKVDLSGGTWTQGFAVIIGRKYA
jgi:hypothetical protein